MELNPAPASSARKGRPLSPSTLVSVRGIPEGTIGTVLELHRRRGAWVRAEGYSVLVGERVCYVKRSDLEPLQ